MREKCEYGQGSQNQLVSNIDIISKSLLLILLVIFTFMVNSDSSLLTWFTCYLVSFLGL